MHPNDICREYRMAKNKKEQIKILADENCTSKEEIMRFLVDYGEIKACEIEKPKAKKHKIPEPVAKALFEKLDCIESRIKPLENELQVLNAEYKEIASFLKNSGIQPESGA